MTALNVWFHVIYLFFTLFISSISAQHQQHHFVQFNNHQQQQHSLNKKPFNASRFEKLAKEAKNPERISRVTKVLSQAAGVYKDKSKGQALNLQKSVFSTVLAYNSEGIFHYKVFFLNFLCFIRHHNIDLVVYILHHNIKDLPAEIAHLESLGVHVLTFPDEIFWNLMLKKDTLHLGKAHANYDSDTPNFHAFGALPMLIPTYEILSFGYNGFYMDVDIGLVLDPIPYMTKGSADFVTSMEIRDCPEFYPSSKADTVWKNLEPNTGTMYVRSTKTGLNLYRKWLELIVESNYMNDQKMFDRRVLDLQYISDCSPDDIYRNEKPIDPNKPTYCFLSEICFQNGKTGVFCQTRPSTRDDWIMEMNRTSPFDVNTRKHYPVTVHVNYSKGKTHELQVRGLWLLYDNQSYHFDHNNTSSEFLVCKPYHVNVTYYHSLDWDQEVSSIVNRREEALRTATVNGTLLKSTTFPSVYLVDDKGFRHAFPDKDTFEGMGFSFGSVRNIPETVMVKIPLGPDLPSLGTAPG